MLKRMIQGCSRVGAFPRSYCSSQDMSAIKAKYKTLGTEGSTHLEVHEDLAKIIFDHPGKRNAFTSNMAVQLHDALLQVEELTQKDSSSLRYLLFTSKGGYFCAGGDKRFVQHVLSPERAHEMGRFMHDSAKRLSRLPLISATYVEGGAIGGGAELSLWTDFLLLHPISGQIGFVQTKMGLLPTWAAGNKLAEELGPRLAARVLLLGEIFDAEQARQIGLAHELAESEEDAIMWLRSKTSHLSPEVVQKTKKLLRLPKEQNRDSILESELEIAASLWNGPTHLAAIKKNIKHRK